MLAVCSHNVLVSNYVPFFDVASKSIEALDAMYCVDGGRYVRERKYGQLVWIVHSPKSMLDMDDDSTHVINVVPHITLCGYEGLAPKEQFVHVFSDVVQFDTWIKGLNPVNLFTVRLERDAETGCYGVSKQLELACERDFTMSPQGEIEWEVSPFQSVNAFRERL